MTRSLRLRATTWLVALAMFTGIVPGGWGALCVTAAEPTFVAPVQGPIVRRFEPPLGPYAAGHRGIDFGVPVGTQIVASGDGVITFAGPVAGDGMFVTIAHNELVQTTYSFMSQVSVTAGQKVRRSEPIGLSGNGHPEDGRPVLHFGLKVAGQYMDPEILLLGNLDDISDLISLAPIADEYDLLIAERSSAHASGRVGSSSLPEPEKPWHIRLGGMIAGWGRSLKDATLGTVSWTKDKALKVGRFVGRVVGGIGHGIGWAFNGAKKAVRATENVLGGFLGEAKDFLVGAGRGLRLVAAEVGDFVGKAARGIGDFVVSAARNVGSFLGSAARGVGDFLESTAQTVGEFIGSAARSVGDFLTSAAQTAGEFLKWGAHQAASSLEWGAGNVVRYLDWATSTANELAKWASSQVMNFVEWAARTAGEALALYAGAARWITEGLTRLASSLWNSISESFLVGMTKGAIEQIRCSRKGGAPPPDLPTSEELQNGVPPPPPPNDNIVIAIGGIGSHTAGENGSVVPGASMYSFDFRTLGFSEDQVYFYSYRGVENRGGSGPYGFHEPYTKEDSYRSIRSSALLLRMQIDAIHDSHPSKRIDLVAHSQGGLVAQYYLTHLYREDDPVSVRIEHMVTIASPHQGADAAQVHHLLSDSQAGRRTLKELDTLATEIGFPPPSAPSVQDMAEGSAFLTDVATRWDSVHVKTTTISAMLDFVVAPPHTRLNNANNYTVNVASTGWRQALDHHSLLVANPASTTILYNALADTPSQCTAFLNAWADHGPGQMIASLEDAAARVLGLTTEGALGR